MSFAAAEQIADAVLYEGYALYPYRASSTKNRVRWQFGVIAPRQFADDSGSDPWFAQTECLIETDGPATIDVRMRGLQVEARTVEIRSSEGHWSRVPAVRVGERDILEWEEGIERTVDHHDVPIASLLEHSIERMVEFEPRRDDELMIDSSGRQVRIRREMFAMRLRMLLDARESAGLTTVRVRVENVTPIQVSVRTRESALGHTLVGTHTLLAVRGGRFLSLLDPPPNAVAAAAACTNQHAWPVLVGDADRRDLILSSPIILYDYPAIAPQSPGNLFDGTEIDEILTLRILTLTDTEKAEARATDTRARDLIDRADSISAETMAGLHGQMHEVRETAPSRLQTASTKDAPQEDQIWRSLLNPEADAPPEAAVAEVNGIAISRGSRVVLRPTRRADPMDMFLKGRLARVDGVYRDLEGRAYVAVILDDDPAGDFHAEVGRFFYYGIEEIEPAGETG